MEKRGSLSSRVSRRGSRGQRERERKERGSFWRSPREQIPLFLSRALSLEAALHANERKRERTRTAQAFAFSAFFVEVKRRNGERVSRGQKERKERGLPPGSSLRANLRLSLSRARSLFLLKQLRAKDREKERSPPSHTKKIGEKEGGEKKKKGSREARERELKEKSQSLSFFTSPRFSLSSLLKRRSPPAQRQSTKNSSLPPHSLARFRYVGASKTEKRKDALVVVVARHRS